MRRIIIHGLRPEYNGLITATHGWATDPTLLELENILANHEALDKQLSSVSIKDDEKALFSKKREFKEKGKEAARSKTRDNRFRRKPGNW